MEFDGNTLVNPPPFVEVELVYETGRPGVSGRGWCALQVWTQNRIYDLEWSMRCFRVVDRETDQPVPGHRLLGARLTGGQRRGGEAMELVYPIPKPGVTAVFEIGEGPKSEWISTSPVERVVLRLRCLSVPEASAKPRWQELSSSFDRAAQGGTQPGHDHEKH